MTGNTWIIIGVIAAALAAFALPYGFYKKSKDHNVSNLAGNNIKENKDIDVIATGDPNNQMNIGRIDGDFVQNQQQTIVNVYNSTPEDIDPSIKSFFQLPRYKTLTIKIGGTFRYVKSKEFLYSISPRLVDNRTVLILKVANEDSERLYFLDEPDAIPLTIYLKIKEEQHLITVEDYDSSGIQVRTYTEK